MTPPFLSRAAVVAAAALALAGCEYHQKSCENNICTLTTNSPYEDEFPNGDRYAVEEIDAGETVTVSAGSFGNEETAELGEGEIARLGEYTAAVESIDDGEVTVVFRPGGQGGG
ncbi:hypothetical protein [Allosalinactinospora lopnorensis]|uniref:hypothetical protein n=1 Tax=Allosalinactinospora lopnorensis TaxID=1352348 RepID=UPI0012E19811|nr:hypothetical protein [Allosalinactinospora lopnorensis]